MGFFSRDYESAGAGISKNAPKKKGIALFFEIFIRKFWLLFGVNMLYFIFFLPMVISFAAISFIKNGRVVVAIIGIMFIVFTVTIGAATAGMTKIMRSFILEKHTFIVRDFFRAFKVNFKKGLAVGALDVFIAASAFSSYYVYPALAQQLGTKLLYIPMVITFSLALVVSMMNFYIYLMMIATDLSLKNLIKNSFALTFISMKKSVLTLVIYLLTLAAMVLIFLYAPALLMFIAPFVPSAQLWFIVCFNSYPEIQKYVINPYYESIGEVNPELTGDYDTDEEAPVFRDMGGNEKPVEKRKPTKGRKIT
ncbi:MAG: DUF624 domain-containing protein [Ruminococcus sp.]|nr:DUF624 domain-containing protein [Ruminococcus sp.]